MYVIAGLFQVDDKGEKFSNLMDIPQSVEVHEKSLKRKRGWKKRGKDKVPPKGLPCTMQEETSQNTHQLVKVHEENQKRKNRGKDKFPSEKCICTLVEVHEQNLKRGGKDDDKVPLVMEHTSQVNRNAQLAKILEQKREKGHLLQEIDAQLSKRGKYVENKVPRSSQEIKNAQLAEISEQKKENDVEDKVPTKEDPLQESFKNRNGVDDKVSSEHPCTSQEKSDENMDAHLMKVCEQYLEEGRKARFMRTRREMLLADPLTYGSSLLNELPSTPGVEKRPPSRSGLGFSISSGNYRPESRRAWNGRLSPLIEENEEVRTGSLAKLMLLITDVHCAGC